MPRTIRIATVQMDANPAPTDERLARAGRLVDGAAAEGARLVVLPEIFNTGYGYSPQNHRRAEPLGGPTATWMKETAARQGVHLAGSLMLLDQDEVYNALLLFAPDGRMWRYDKNYPWGWERGYFRDSERITVAHTDLGKIGFLICWDSGHTGLWRRYAGRVDLMVISSCPPDISNPTFHLPSGEQVTVDRLGPAFAMMRGAVSATFGEMLNQQAAWLGVPAVNTVGAGHIRTDIPQGTLSLLGLATTAPWLARYLPQADRLQMSCDMAPGCKIVDAAGRVVTELTVEQGESFAIGDVALADETPVPRGPQPAAPLPKLTYLVSDTLLPQITIPVYRNGLRQAWGEEMAPVSSTTRRWTAVLGLGVAVGLLVGLLLGGKRSR